MNTTIAPNPLRILVYTDLVEDGEHVLLEPATSDATSDQIVSIPLYDIYPHSNPVVGHLFQLPPALAKKLEK